MTWDVLADDAAIEKTKKALEANGIKTIVVASGEKAKIEVLKLIPKDAEVMTATSTTADQIGLSKVIDESGDYDSTRKKIMSLPQSEMRTQARRINAAVDYVVGSVHALTEDGHAIIASNSGSQLAAYVFSAAHVIWVIGAQKIVKDDAEGIKRIRKHTLPLENQRMQQTYGMDSNISKVLIVNKEVMPERITVILVKEKLGF